MLWWQFHAYTAQSLFGTGVVKFLELSRTGEWGNLPIAVKFKSKMFCVLWRRVSIEHWRLSPGRGHSASCHFMHTALWFYSPFPPPSSLLRPPSSHPPYVLRGLVPSGHPPAFFSQNTQASPGQRCRVSSQTWACHTASVQPVPSGTNPEEEADKRLQTPWYPPAP